LHSRRDVAALSLSEALGEPDVRGMDVEQAQLGVPSVPKAVRDARRRRHKAPRPRPEDLFTHLELRLAGEHVERVDEVVVNVRIDALEIGPEAQLDEFELRQLGQDAMVPLGAPDLLPTFGAERDDAVHKASMHAKVRTIASVEELLLAWFRREGRDLPWRKTNDPYAILVSEVMLQQTQVERVVPRYVAWLERWPAVAWLAAASRGDVILAWQGLGYNRRAVALHAAAQRVAADGWPDNLTELPGVGPYTAAAIRRFAFGEPVLPRDVNVQRVLDRTGHLFTPEAAQALMDLGATVCIARVPRCPACPLRNACPARGTRYEPARKQGPFEGSFRQRRAETLRLVAAQPTEVEALDREAVASLARDGLVQVVDGVVALPR
jgi:A/G-specific adenine glycosylase